MTTFDFAPVVTGPSTQPVLDFLGSPQHLLLAGEQTSGELALLTSTGERGFATPWHRHQRASETFVVLEGELLLEVDGHRQVAGPGYAAALPRGLAHGFVVVSDTARWLTLHTPAGFEDFVRDVADAHRDGAAPDRATLTAIAHDHDIEILGPGITADLPTT